MASVDENRLRRSSFDIFYHNNTFKHRLHKFKTRRYEQSILLYEIQLSVEINPKRQSDMLHS